MIRANVHWNYMPHLAALVVAAPAVVMGISGQADARTVTGSMSLLHWVTTPKNCFNEYYSEIRAVNNAPAHANQCNDFSTLLSNVPVITPLFVDSGDEVHDVRFKVSGANVGLQAPISCRAYGFTIHGTYYQSSQVTANTAGPAYQTLPSAYVYVPNGGYLESVCYFPTGGEGLVAVDYAP